MTTGSPPEREKTRSENNRRELRLTLRNAQRRPCEGHDVLFPSTATEVKKNPNTGGDEGEARRSLIKKTHTHRRLILIPAKR